MDIVERRQRALLDQLVSIFFFFFLPKTVVVRLMFGSGSATLASFTNWLKQNNKKGFLGEFGGSETTECFQALTDALQHMQDNNDVWFVAKIFKHYYALRN